MRLASFVLLVLGMISTGHAATIAGLDGNPFYSGSLCQYNDANLADAPFCSGEVCDECTGGCMVFASGQSSVQGCMDYWNDNYAGDDVLDTSDPAVDIADKFNTINLFSSGTCVMYYSDPAGGACDPADGYAQNHVMSASDTAQLFMWDPSTINIGGGAYGGTTACTNTYTGPDGSQCVCHGDCMSGSCTGGVCDASSSSGGDADAGTTCTNLYNKTAGEDCACHGDCASGYCNGGHCDAQTSSSSTSGCTDSGATNYNDDGLCEYLDNSRAPGETCAVTADCIGGETCASGVCECIEVGQRVLMADGTHKNVEHLVPGDMLRTPDGVTAVRSTRRGGRHLSAVHDVECAGKTGAITGNHAYHCEGEWRLPQETHEPRALSGTTEVVAVETDNYCEDRMILEGGLHVETWDGRGIDEWRPHTYENGRRLRCTLKGTWRDRVLKRVDSNQ